VIGVWMGYVLTTGVLMAFICTLAERMARAAGVATRTVWVGGMATMLVVAAATFFSGDRTPAARAEATAADAPAGVAAPVRGRPDRRGAVATLGERISGAIRAAEARVAVASVAISRWDRPLLILWALTAAFLAGVVAHAALEGERLRRGLQAREMEGTAVLLTDGVGPSAIGIGGPAILMPRWALDLDDALMKLVLRHEREHLAARDPLLLLATLFAVVLVPWHLPLWWSWRRLRLAIVVDCDTRVLCAHPDVRRYAQLLLLTAQRTSAPSWASRPVLSVTAPLRPHASHLERRISAMTQPRTSRALLRIIPLAVGALPAAALLLALPSPPRAVAQRAAGQARAVVHLTSVGTANADSSTSFLIYTTEGARVGVGIDAPAARADTLRLDGLPAITADVTDGEVHIEVHGAGTMRVSGDVTGGPARRLSGGGRHIVLLKGGIGVKVDP
jgi:bla regulator protein blaR1